MDNLRIEPQRDPFIERLKGQLIDRLGLTNVKSVGDIIRTKDPHVDMALNGERNEVVLRREMKEQNEFLNAAIQAKFQAKVFMESAFPATLRSSDDRKIALAYMAKAAKLFLLANATDQFVSTVYDMTKFSRQVTVGLSNYHPELLRVQRTSQDGDSVARALAAMSPPDDHRLDREAAGVRHPDEAA